MFLKPILTERKVLMSISLSDFKNRFKFRWYAVFTDHKTPSEPEISKQKVEKHEVPKQDVFKQQVSKREVPMQVRIDILEYL